MKFIFNKALFKEQLRRFWPLSVLSFLIYLWFITVPDSYYVDDFYILSPAVMLTSLFFPVIIVQRIFSYLFNPKESVTVLVYPISKTSLWFTNLLTGFVLMTMPILILLILNLVMVPELYLDQGSQYIFTWFFAINLVFVFNYAFCLIVAHISGNTIVYNLLTFSIPVMYTGLFLISIQIAQGYIFGVDFRNEIMWNIFKYTNPIIIFLLYDSFYFNDDNIIELIIYFAVIFFGTIFLFGISFFANHKRKQECTGDSVVFKSLKNIVIFLICIFGMFLGSSIFTEFDFNESFINFGMVVGFLISYYISQMIFRKSFNIFKEATKEIYKFCICTILIVGLMLSIITLTERYTPNPNDIAGVSLNYYSHKKYYVENKTIINDLISVHKKIINNKNKILAMDFSDSSNYYITYKLKNGKTIEREYRLEEYLAKEIGIHDLYHNEEFMLVRYFYLDTPENIKGVLLDGPKIYINLEDPEQIKNFILELKKDISNESKATGSDYYHYTVYLKDGSDSNNFRLKFNENSMEWLKENGHADLFN